MNRTTEFSPAKLNLLLTITGRRADGFHDLVSVATPLAFGDDLEVVLTESGAGGRFTLECNEPEVPVDSSNLILKAADAFVTATDWKGYAHFKLTKRTPMGAGLGGGSSNAVAALRALNRLAGGLLKESELADIAATLGSDCVLFLKNAPVIMRGRGERVELMSTGAAERLCGRRVLVFKPSFGISTPWAYKRMIARGTDYLPEAVAEARLATWMRGDDRAESLLFNNMEPAAFEKFIALPTMLKQVRERFGVAAQMSGSGSACYALLSDDFEAAPLVAFLQSGWGDAIFVQETRLA